MYGDVKRLAGALFSPLSYVEPTELKKIMGKARALLDEKVLIVAGATYIGKAQRDSSPKDSTATDKKNRACFFAAGWLPIITVRYVDAGKSNAS